MSRMQLRVCIDIRSLKGDICAWLPPPPGDRLWYSFLSAPSLELDVKPVVRNSIQFAPVFWHTHLLHVVHLSLVCI